MRTWSFSIASKRAQDHQNRSPDVKVMHVLLLGRLQFLCWPDVRAFPGMSPATAIQRASDLCEIAGCPAPGSDVRP